MASFPIGTTPFLLEILGSSVQEIPPTPNDAGDAEAGPYFLIPLIRGQKPLGWDHQPN